jgi:hypothetical protein
VALKLGGYKMIKSVEQLQKLLDTSKTPKYWYRICPKGYWEQGDAGLIDDKYVLDFENGKWVTYYSERGQRSNFQTFSSESEACDYFYSFLKEKNSQALEHNNGKHVKNWENVL